MIIKSESVVKMTVIVDEEVYKSLRLVINNDPYCGIDLYFMSKDDLEFLLDQYDALDYHIGLGPRSANAREQLLYIKNHPAYTFPAPNATELICITTEEQRSES